MVFGSGLGSQLSFGKESAYGTAATLNHFLPADKVSLKEVKGIVEGGGFQGQLGKLSTRRRQTTTHATGTIDTQITNRGLGLFLQNLMGTSVTPVQNGSTTAYTQTHTWADNYGKSLTIQNSVPTLGGTAVPYTFKGCKTVSLDLSVDTTSTTPFMGTWTYDAKEVVTNIVVPAASYTTSTYPFVGRDVAIVIDTAGDTTPSTSVDGVTKLSLKIERPQKTDRFYFGASGVTAEPVQNDWGKITGVLTVDFLAAATFADRFASQSGFSLGITATGSAIGVSGYNDTFQVILPYCVLDGDTPTVESQDVVSGDFPFTVYFDTSPFITVISDESSL